MLTPFDDYPIHPSADPIAHPATGDPNHYDRYWFNGQSKDGAFFLGRRDGPLPRARAWSTPRSASSTTASSTRCSRRAGCRSTARTEVGPIRVEVVEPLRVLRLVADRDAQGRRLRPRVPRPTVAIEEPRQRLIGDDGVLVMDHTRLTQWGTWEGTIWIDGTTIDVDPATTVATRDRSWGVRRRRQAGGDQPRRRALPQVFWLWAPLHFDDFCTHMALHERTDGDRWLETALIVPLLDRPTGRHGPKPEEMEEIRYEIEWEPGRREMR